MVVIVAPSMRPIGTEHERIGWPLIWTVQAPHSATPQPNFVPVRPTTSRSTQSSGVSRSISSWCCVPLTLIVIMMALPRGSLLGRGALVLRRAPYDQPELSPLAQPVQDTKN